MTLSSCILITITVCISAILMQTYFDSRKYKRIPHLLVLLSFLFPTLSNAQYLEVLTDDQTLVIESGHPLGLFKSKPHWLMGHHPPPKSVI